MWVLFCFYLHELDSLSALLLLAPLLLVVLLFSSSSPALVLLWLALPPSSVPSRVTSEAERECDGDVNAALPHSCWLAERWGGGGGGRGHAEALNLFRFSPTSEETRALALLADAALELPSACAWWC